MSPQLPASPSLEQLRKQAKSLLKAHRRRDPSACGVLRRLRQFADRSDDEILDAPLKLDDVQFALAMDYGLKSWAALKAHVESSSRLSKGKGAEFDWTQVIGTDQPHCTIAGGELVVESPAGEGAGLHVELGGMSWDNYRLGVDVLVERESSWEPHFDAGRFPAGVQLCPRGTCVYCQLFRGVVNLAYWDNDREEHFTHLASVQLPAALAMRTWHRFEILVQSPRVVIFLDGEELIDKDVPTGAAGMPGLVVNYNSDAKVRLRDLRIRFVSPSRQQVEEFNTDPQTNWENYKRRQVEEGLRPSMADNSL